MFGRENLKEEWADCLVCETLVYDAVNADEVMDKMEASVKPYLFYSYISNILYLIKNRYIFKEL